MSENFQFLPEANLLNHSKCYYDKKVNDNLKKVSKYLIKSFSYLENSIIFNFFPKIDSLILERDFIGIPYKKIDETLYI